MKHILIASVIIMIIVYLCSCQVSNKTHWQRIHPTGGYAGRHWIKGNTDSIKTIVNK